MDFPSVCKKQKSWICWRYIPDKDGKLRKVPIDPKNGNFAKCNDSTTWSDYETAEKAVSRYGCEGVGFVLQKQAGFIVIDIDHCYDPVTKTFNETATVIIERQNTYMEFSPSGTGVHIWFRGEKPGEGSKNTETGVEMYDDLRYMTVTGNRLDGALNEIADASPDTLTWIHSNYIAKKLPVSAAVTPCSADGVSTESGSITKGQKSPSPRKTDKKLTDEEVIAKIKSSKIGAAFLKLWNGQWDDDYSSHSEADLALCRMLAFGCCKDTEQMDRLFRASGLMRAKWTEIHYENGTTYGDATISKAVNGKSDTCSAASGTGVYESGGRYFVYKKGEFVPITNFVIKAIEILYSTGDTQLTADFISDTGYSVRMTFFASDFTNHTKFKLLLNRQGINLSFFGSELDLELLKNHISGYAWQKKRGVNASGIYIHDEKAIYVSSIGCITAKGLTVDNITQMANTVDIRSDILNARLLSRDQLSEIGSCILSYNDAKKTLSILAWVSGCFVKPYLRLHGVKFPHLFLIGEAGSGKSTTLEHVILPIFAADQVVAASQVTPFTLLKSASSSNLIPLMIDEFKPSKIDKTRIHTLYNYFRDSYDGHQAVRGHADQTKTTYDLIAPTVIAGEEAAEEAAIRERTIELLFSKKDIQSAECCDAFARIMSNRDIMQNFGLTLLRAVLTITPDTVFGWYRDGLTQFCKDLPSRVVSNLSALYAGLKLLETVCIGYRLLWDDLFPYPFVDCVHLLEAAAREYLLDGGTYNPTIVDQTLEIMARMEPEIEYEYYIVSDSKLYLKLSKIYDDYTKYRKDHALVGECLPYAQFKKQLKHSDIFIEENAQKRFPDGNSRCWVLDFAKLSTRIDVSGFLT